MKNEVIVLVGIAPNLTHQFIERCKVLNYKVIIIENKTDIIKNSKLIKEADKIVSADISTYELLKNEINKINNKEKIFGVITFREYYTENTAKIIQELNLYGVPLKVVQNCNNKYISRLQFDNSRLVTQTKYKLCKNENDVIAFFNNVKGTIIIKPLEEKGGFGAYRINCIEDIKKFYSVCCSFDQKGEGIIAEEYINGKELAFEVYVSKGKSFILGIAQKNMFKTSNTFIASGYTTIEKSSIFSLDEYELIIQEIIDKMNINFGPVLIEGFETKNKKFYFGEIHTRYAGEHIFEITENASGYDLLTPIIKGLTGNEDNNICKNKKNILKKVSGSRAIYPREGIIKKIYGIGEARKICGVQSVEIFCNSGDKVNFLKSSTDRIGWIVASAKNKEDLEQIFEEAFLKIYIEMEEKL